ncbi:MAG: hypothetical protein ACTHVO_14350 [Brevibacterium yomogidense]
MTGLRHRFFAGAAVATVLIAPAPAASADTGPMEYSEDGVLWATTPPASLFEDDIVLVPGASATETVHLRSLAETPGILQLSVLNVAASTDAAAEAFGVIIVESSGDGAHIAPERYSIAELSAADVTTSGIRIDPGETVEISVTVDIDAEVTDSVAQHTAVDLDLALRVIDAAGGGEESSEHAARPAAPETDTGARTAPAASTGQGGTAFAAPEAGHPRSGDLAMTGIQRGLFLLTGTVLAMGVLFAVLGRIRRRREP